MSQREEKISATIKEFADKLPKFPDGRIDYSNSGIAPVIVIFIKNKEKILILKRSNKVRTYQGKWNTVAGYLDELKPIREKALEEIKEELGIKEDNILSFHLGEAYDFMDTKIGKSWICCPVMLELKRKPEIKIDWEHTEHKWIKSKEAKDFDTVPNFNKSLRYALR